MKREDFKEIKKEHFETCEYIVENEGSCFSISCGNCPFSYLNSVSELECMDNGYSNGGGTTNPDNKLVVSAKEFLKFREEGKMKKEKVLEVEFQDVFDKVACRIKYQNEEVLKRGEFEDDEINVISVRQPTFRLERLYLRGNNKEKDNFFEIVSKYQAGIIKQKVDAINEKYGIPKRWRAKKGGKYFYITGSVSVGYSVDDYIGVDDDRYAFGNYFKTKKEAEVKLKKIKLIFKED